VRWREPDADQHRKTSKYVLRRKNRGPSNSDMQYWGDYPSPYYSLASLSTESINVLVLQTDAPCNYGLLVPRRGDVKKRQDKGETALKAGRSVLLKNCTAVRGGGKGCSFELK